MSRLSYLHPTQLTADQKELYDSIAGGPRAHKRPGLVDAEGHLTGPFNAYLHLPVLGKLWSGIGETLRFKTALERRLFELAILVVAAEWKSGHEWAAHAKLAEAAGIGAGAIAAIRAGTVPQFDKRDEQLVYDFVRELVAEHRVGAASYRALADLLGETRTVELVNAVAYYVALAAMLNAFDVHPPQGLDDPWP